MSVVVPERAAIIPDPKPLAFVLLRLLSDGEFHSGETLARQLGVSRASVNNALASVADYGLVLHSIRGRGYRLLNAPVWLDAGKIHAGLSTTGTHFHLEILECANSSNSILLQKAALGAPHASVLAVEWQSGGRGRLGRAWHSGLGNALTFSVLWRFNCGLADLSGLSLVVGIALIRVLRQYGAADIGLKWPNDVIGRQGKLAGILIEAQGDMLGPCVAVIGIGLNLKLPQEILQRIDQPVSALDQYIDGLPERNELLAEILKQIDLALDLFSTRGFASMREEWESYHVYHNRKVTMLMPDGSSVEGIVKGVNAEGALRVETGQGVAGTVVREFHAGEISMREAKDAAV